jgi:hypothetical protein
VQEEVHNLLTKESSFALLLSALREKLRMNPNQLANAIKASGLGSITHQTIRRIENGMDQRPQARVVSSLASFLHSRQILISEEDLTIFCVRAGYRPASFQYTDDRDRLKEVRLAPLSETNERDVRDLFWPLFHLAPRVALIRSILSAFEVGLESFAMNALVPDPGGQGRNLITRAERLLRSETFDEGTANQLISDIQRYLSVSDLVSDRFRLPYYLVRLLDRAGRYTEALNTANDAYDWANNVARRKGSIYQEPLARLTEEMGRVCLNIGTPEHWARAEGLFRESLHLRQELGLSVRLLLSENEAKIADDMLQIARARTAARDFQAAEEGYSEILRRRRGVRGILKAHVLKELADVYRLTRRTQESISTFEKALNAYWQLPRWHSRSDPSLPIEATLNGAYCLRRLGRDAEADGELKRALEVAHRAGDRRRVAYSCLQIARSPTLTSQPQETAYYTAIALGIMQEEGAEEDAEQARAALEQVLRQLSRDDIEILTDRLRSSPYGAYAKFDLDRS